MKTKTPHIHAAIIAEAIQDTSLKIYGKHIRGDFWDEVTLSFVASSDHMWQFRFKIVSSLTDHELCTIVDENNPCREDINYSIIRAVANAAAAKHDADITRKKQPPDLKVDPFSKAQNLLTAKELESLYKNAGLKFQIF